MKRLLILILFLFLSADMPSACFKYLIIPSAHSYSDYENLFKAICAVESNHNPLAWIIDTNGKPSVGIVQIQQSRLDHFNKLTGKKYKLSDMYNVKKAKEVFMIYCTDDDFERISRCRNVGPNGMRKKSTEKYWQKVRKHL